jgi:branched-chain amino acid aminotransferase
MTIDPVPLPLAVPGEGTAEFGTRFTDHMVTATWSESAGWGDVVLAPRGPLLVDPAMVGLHYGQSVFEGLKAHRQENGDVVVFRVDAHARRMRASAARLVMPEVPEEMFTRAVDLLVGRDQHHLGDDLGESLYLRPLLVATEPNLALRPARSFLFLLQAFTTGAFFGSGFRPVTVRVSVDQARAARGGTGAVKAAGNYAAAYSVQRAAADDGCDQVVWLDPVAGTHVEEMGAMNLFFVRGRGAEAVVSTPPATGSLLAGVTRDSLLALAAAAGLTAVEEPMALADWHRGCVSGEITETFACGTAAIVAPVGEVRAGDLRWTVGDGAFPVATALFDALRAVQRGTAPDPQGWLRHVPSV